MAALVALLGSTTGQAATQPTATLRVDSNASGEIQINARGVTLEDALGAIASKAGFEVVLDSGIARPPVNMAVSMASVEDVLRQLLRGRNYALVYDADDASLSRVIVLPPPGLGNRGAAYRRGNWRNAVRTR